MLPIIIHCIVKYYRYHDNPIGADIDGDSHNSGLNLLSVPTNGSFQLKYQRMSY